MIKQGRDRNRPGFVLFLIYVCVWAASFLAPAQAADLWQYGGFADVGYLHNFNHPDNHLWRSKQTSPEDQ